MGFFSWVTSDTGESVMNCHSVDGATPCKMMDDKGNEYIEPSYDGYGDFQGVDFYALVDRMNGGDGDRDRGIQLCDVNHFDPAPESIKTPRIVSIECTTQWADLEPSKSCPLQGYFS